MVEEDMANAAREHATESGKSLDGRTMIAFGGGAPAHAVRLANKLGIDRIMIPKNAGVGSAVGFLRAPMSYEISRSARIVMSQFDVDKLNAVFDDISRAANQVLERGARGEECHEERLAYMRYVGQGHEVPVKIPPGVLTDSDSEMIVERFDLAYRKLYERSLGNLEIEIVGMSVAVSTRLEKPSSVINPEESEGRAPDIAEHRELFNPETNDFGSIPVYRRTDLLPGATFDSPAIVSEEHTTTTIPHGYRVIIDGNENMIVEKRPGTGG
jgi:N-methylhydantoinase A